MLGGGEGGLLISSELKSSSRELVGLISLAGTHNLLSTDVTLFNEPLHKAVDASLLLLTPSRVLVLKTPQISKPS